MRSVRKRFAFREDAIEWIRTNGFQYVDHHGWINEEHKMCAIVEFSQHAHLPWVLSAYKSAVPTVNR
jgi:hypothetical protein